MKDDWGGMRALSGVEMRRVLGMGGGGVGSGAVPHRVRETVVGSFGVHVTTHLRDGIPGLRRKRVIQVLEGCLRAAKDRMGVKVFAYTVMDNHLHLIVAARTDADFRSGVQGLLIRLSRAINRVFGRSGSVFRDRFFARVLRSKRTVFYALRYAVQNARKHGVPIPEGQWDRYSSGRFIHNNDIPVAEYPVALADVGEWPWIAVAMRFMYPSVVPGPVQYD